MRWLACCLVVVSGVVSGVTWAEEPVQQRAPAENECREPEMMLIPDGNNASSPEMLDSQAQVELYIANTRNHLNCLLASEKAIGDALTYEQKKDSIMRYNLAVARMEGLVESFNQQLRTYKRVNAE